MDYGSHTTLIIRKGIGQTRPSTDHHLRFRCIPGQWVDQRAIMKQCTKRSKINRLSQVGSIICAAAPSKAVILGGRAVLGVAIGERDQRSNCKIRRSKINLDLRFRIDDHPGVHFWSGSIAPPRSSRYVLSGRGRAIGWERESTKWYGSCSIDNLQLMIATGFIMANAVAAGFAYVDPVNVGWRYGSYRVSIKTTSVIR